MLNMPLPLCMYLHFLQASFIKINLELVFNNSLLTLERISFFFWGGGGGGGMWVLLTWIYFGLKSTLFGPGTSMKFYLQL